MNNLSSERNKETIVINKRVLLYLKVINNEGNKKILRFKKGLETSRNVGYLFYYFLTM